MEEQIKSREYELRQEFRRYAELPTTEAFEEWIIRKLAILQLALEGADCDIRQRPLRSLPE
jgi:hypothetical protein